jgi:YVTN family beta-propeller protein
MEFRLLGSLEVLVDGRQIPLGGARQRAVLAILLLHRGEAVSVDRVVDELWGERPPDAATKTVQVYVSRLRKLLGDGILVTRPGGYSLELGANEVDAERFARLAGEGREALDRSDARSAAETLRAALDLWRGPPLADLAYESFAQNEIGRLTEMHLAALEDRIEADLALGRHAELVPELQTLVREHPARERLLGQLMLALYRSGRQSDALESYRDAKRRLVEELGLEPGHELQQLERAILSQDPAIAGPPPAGAVAALRQRGRGGALVALGGGLLLAAAIAAIVVAGGGDAETELVSANSLAVIDPGSNRLAATVPTGVRPAEVSADGDHVWVANRGDDTATQIDPRTKAVVRTTSPGVGVAGLAAGAGGVWIADSRGSELVRLDPGFASVVRSIQLAPGPEVFGISALNPVAVGYGAVWVGKSSGGVARVDPESDEVVAKVPVGNDPSSIATGLGGVWIADDVDNTVTRIDPASANAVTATTPVGQGPAALAAGEGAVWVANTQDDAVARIDPRTAAVIETIPVGRRPTGIAAAGGAVWVANSLSGTVSRIDPETNRVEATVETGEAPQGVTVANGLVWVSVQSRAAPPEAPAVATEGNVARVLVPADPGTTDPALGDAADFQMRFATCALLYNYPDRPFPEGARLQPEVAGGQPSVSSDGLTYTFRLRPGFRFSPPSNEAVTAAAFERAIERTLSPRMGSLGAVLMRDIVGAEAYIAGRAKSLAGVSARGNTLVVELTRPAPDLLARLSTPYFCAVPPDTPITAEGVDPLPSAGPYYVASHVPDRSLVLRRNPNYDGPRPQGLAEIHYEIGLPPERGVAEVEAGRADYVVLHPLLSAPVPEEVERRLTARFGARSEAARAGRQQLFTQPTAEAYYFLFNARRGPFAEARLRRAVNYAIDRRALAAHTGLGPRGRPTDQYIPPGLPGFEDAAIYPLGGPDLATARRLAGSRPRAAVLYTCSLPGCSRHAEILRSNLRAIGIELDVRQFPLGEMFARIRKPGELWDLTYWNWFVDYPDPSNFINDQFAVGGFGELPGLAHDADLERRMEAASRLTGEARLRAYARLDRDLAEQEMPAAAFASGTVSHFLSARMGCQVLHPIYGLDLAALCVRPDVDGE